MGDEAKDFRGLFPHGQIPVVLSSILQAGSTLQKKTERDREDWITRRLYKRLILIPTFRDGPLGIHLKPEIISINLDADTPAGEIDLLVSCGRGYEIYFPLEAKRLRVRSPKGEVIPGSGAYVNDGMMRFITGKYAPCMEAAAMLGYVFDGKMDLARVDVNRVVRSKCLELKLISPKQLLRSNILPASQIGETRHDLGKRSFVIYHVFLSV